LYFFGWPLQQTVYHPEAIVCTPCNQPQLTACSTKLAVYSTEQRMSDELLSYTIRYDKRV